VLDVIAAFIAELRRAGIPISMTEHLDAAQAMAVVSLEERETLRETLAATLIKSHDHRGAFDLAFDIYFSPRHGILTGEISDTSEHAEHQLDDEIHEMEGGVGQRREMSADELTRLIEEAIRRSDESLRNQVAQESVTRFAGMTPGRPVGGTYYLYRVLRNLDLEGLEQRMGDEALAARRGANLGAIEQRLILDELARSVRGLKLAIEAEIRRRLVEDRGAEALATSVRKPLPEDIDIMHTTREEIQTLERSLLPLSRKLAARLMRKRRHGRRGALDVRATMRHSLSTGGVPIDPKYKNPRPSKPEIFIIADVSGSVASFARFTLHLVYALASSFSKVRSFVFVDAIDEVTKHFETSLDPAEAAERVNAQAKVVWVDGHSDYGHALSDFHARFGEEVNSRTTVMILGDARNNYHQSSAWVVADLQKRARHVLWLNPEPRSYWNSGDSIIGEYGAHCDSITEVRTLRQLEAFISELV
jgi:uncharacterized protein with von Willebrand factor type A (vWA) domain